MPGQAMPGRAMPGQAMDDILASIKRIIAEDAPSGPAPPPSHAEEEVLELGAAPPPPAAEADALVSNETEAASRKALAALAGLTIDSHAGANTLDGLVREMLRPMLKDWLDANLPELVSRMVAREVARLGGR